MHVCSYIHYMKTIDTNNLKQITRTTTSFKLLSDPTRVRILCLLYKSKDGMCVNEIAEDISISQSAISHQLSKLEDRGVVHSFREGQSVCYRLAHTSFVKELISVMLTFQS